MNLRDYVVNIPDKPTARQLAAVLDSWDHSSDWLDNWLAGREPAIPAYLFWRAGYIVYCARSLYEVFSYTVKQDIVMWDAIDFLRVFQ
jgi:hypothetical protein